MEAARESSADTQNARTVYNQSMPDVSHRGTVLYQRVCDHDAIAHMIMSRDPEYRLMFINGIRKTLEKQYAFALNNEDDQTFRHQFDRFFRIIRSESSIASTLQMFLVHVAILLEPEVERWLVPPTPDPDATGEAAVDMADVNRDAFQMYVENYLAKAFGDLLNSGTMSVLRMVRELNAAYTAHLPPDPLADALRDNARRIAFTDAEAVECLRRRWGPSVRFFKMAKPRLSSVAPPSLEEAMAAANDNK